MKWLAYTIGFLLCSCVVVRGEDDRTSKWTDLLVTPRAIEEPLLKHRLFPSDGERQPGNAAVVVLRWERHPEWAAKTREQAAKYLTIPDDEFSSKSARDDVQFDRYDEFRRAAYRRDVDWEYPLDDGRRHELLGLPDFGQCRVTFSALAVHCRADIADGKIEDACDKLASGFGMASHLQEIPLAIPKAVVADGAGLMLDRVEQLVQHDDTRNLYWALTGIPDPLIETHKLVEWGHRDRPWHVPETKDLSRVGSERRWREFRQQLGVFRSFSAGGLAGFEIENPPPLLKVDLDRARKQLPKLRPKLADRVATMSEDELTVRYFIVRYQTENDRFLSSLLLPPHQGLRWLDRAGKRFEKLDEEPFRSVVLAYRWLALRIWSVDRRIDALRIVESLRDHAATHDGQLPDSLGEVENAPIPTDNLTGEPFRYRLEGATAYLSAPSVADGGQEVHGIHYRIRVVK